MGKLGFFTAVSFGDQAISGTKWLLENVDSYFHLGGKKAYVIQGGNQQGSEGVTLKEDGSRCLVTAIKVISYATVIFPLIMIIAKIVLRSIHTFYVISVRECSPYDQPVNPFSLFNPLDAKPCLIEAKQKLEEGIEIPEKITKQIEQLLPKILNREEDEEIIWHAQENNLVFRLKKFPRLIFKMGVPGKLTVIKGRGLSAEQLIQLRFDNMAKAVDVCRENHLDLLVVPHAKMCKAERHTLIAEEYLEVNEKEGAQNPCQLPVLEQLVDFIAETGFSDVEWRNMLLTKDGKVVFVDLEEMEGAEIGIYGGGNGRRGLVGCLHSEEQIDAVLAAAEKRRIFSRNKTPEQVKARRMEEIQFERPLQDYYQRNGILENPRKLIEIEDLSILGLDLQQESISVVGGKITLQKVVLDVIGAINNAIKDAPANQVINEMRRVVLNLQDAQWWTYYIIGKPRRAPSRIDDLTEQEEKQRWLRKVVDALVEKGYLFQFLDNKNSLFRIQA